MPCMYDEDNAIKEARDLARRVGKDAYVWFRSETQEYCVALEEPKEMRIRVTPEGGTQLIGGR